MAGGDAQAGQDPPAAVVGDTTNTGESPPPRHVDVAAAAAAGAGAPIDSAVAPTPPAPAHDPTGHDLKDIAEVEAAIATAVSASNDAESLLLRKRLLAKVVENFSAPTVEPDMRALIFTVQRATATGAAAGIADETFALCTSWLTRYTTLRGAVSAEEWSSTAGVALDILLHTVTDPVGVFVRPMSDACALVEILSSVFTTAAEIGSLKQLAPHLYALATALPFLSFDGGRVSEAVAGRYLRMLCVGMTFYDVPLRRRAACAPAATTTTTTTPAAVATRGDAPAEPSAGGEGEATGSEARRESDVDGGRVTELHPEERADADGRKEDTDDDDDDDETAALRRSTMHRCEAAMRGANIGGDEVVPDVLDPADPMLYFPKGSAAHASRLLLVYHLMHSTYAALYFLRSFINSRPSVALSLVQQTQLVPGPNASATSAPHAAQELGEIDLRTYRGAINALKCFTFPKTRACQYDLSTKEMLVVLHSFRYAVAYCGNAWPVVYDVITFAQCIFTTDVVRHLESHWHVLLSVLKDVLSFYTRVTQQEMQERGDAMSFVVVPSAVYSPGDAASTAAGGPAETPVEAAVRAGLFEAATSVLRLMDRIELDMDRDSALAFAEACLHLFDPTQADCRAAHVQIMEHQLASAPDAATVASILRRRLHVNNFRTHLPPLNTPSPWAACEELQKTLIAHLRKLFMKHPFQQGTFLEGLVALIYTPLPDAAPAAPAAESGGEGLALTQTTSTLSHAQVSERSFGVNPVAGSAGLRPVSPKGARQRLPLPEVVPRRTTFGGEEWSAPVAREVLQILVEVVVDSTWAKGLSEGVELGAAFPGVLRACLDVVADDAEGTALDADARAEVCREVIRVAASARCTEFTAACCGELWDCLVRLLAHGHLPIRSQVLEFFASLTCDAGFEVQAGAAAAARDSIGVTLVAREPQTPYECELPIAALLDMLGTRLLHDGELCGRILKCLRVYLSDNFMIMGNTAATAPVLAKLPKQLLMLLADPLDMKTRLSAGGLLTDIVGCVGCVAAYSSAVATTAKEEFVHTLLGIVTRALAKACEVRGMFPAGGEAVLPVLTEIFGVVHGLLYQCLRETDVAQHPVLREPAARLLRTLADILKESSPVLDVLRHGDGPQGVASGAATGQSGAAPPTTGASTPAPLDTVTVHAAAASHPPSPSAGIGTRQSSQATNAATESGEAAAQQGAAAGDKAGNPPAPERDHDVPMLNPLVEPTASTAPAPPTAGGAPVATAEKGSAAAETADAPVSHEPAAAPAPAVSQLACKQYVVSLLSLLHSVAVSVLTDDDRASCRLPAAVLTYYAEAQTHFLFDVIGAAHDHRVHFLAHLVVSELLLTNRRGVFPLKHRQSMLTRLAQITKAAAAGQRGAQEGGAEGGGVESPQRGPAGVGAGAGSAEMSRAIADLAWRTHFMGSADPYPQWDPLTEALFADGDTQCFVTQGPHAPSVLSITKGRAQHMLITIRSLASVVCWTCVLHNRPTQFGERQCLGAGAQVASGRDPVPAAGASATCSDVGTTPMPMSTDALQQDHDDFMRGLVPEATFPMLISSDGGGGGAAMDVESGTDGMSMKDSAKGANVSPRSPFEAPRHFVPVSDDLHSLVSGPTTRPRDNESPSCRSGAGPGGQSPTLGEAGDDEASMPRVLSGGSIANPPVYYPPDADVKLFTCGAAVITCRDHHKPRCAECSLTTRQKHIVSVQDCCAAHHQDGTGDTLPVRVCQRHRMTRCSGCRSLTECCALHHVCKAHSLRTCPACRGVDTPTGCCAKGHHATEAAAAALKVEPLRAEEDWKDEVDTFIPRNYSYDPAERAHGIMGRSANGFPIVISTEDLSATFSHVPRQSGLPVDRVGTGVSPYFTSEHIERRVSTPGGFGMPYQPFQSYITNLTTPVPAPSLSASEALASIIDLLGNSVHAAFILSIFKVNPPPVRLRFDKELVRTLTSLDRLPCKETHKIGLVYIDHKQYRPEGTEVLPSDAAKWGERETLVLSNDGGSLRYQTFINGLGRYKDLRVQREDPRETVRKGAWPHPCHYFGALDTLRQQDGPMCVMWESQVHQVVYHIATLMQPPDTGVAAVEPGQAKQHRRIAADKKKRHIGNDHVVITYCEDPAHDINPFVLKNELNYINILVQPLSQGYSRVSVHFRDCKEETARSLKELLDETSFGPALCRGEGAVVADARLPQFVAQAALHASVATKSWRFERQQYISNWGERLNRIEQLPHRFGVRSDQLSLDDTIVMGYHA